MNGIILNKRLENKKILLATIILIGLGSHAYAKE